MAAGALPAGTVTFLFTDIERSTQNVALLGDERYAELQDVHRGLLRRSFATHSGVEVGTEGDAFFVAFARAKDAVDAAIEGQRALESHQWPGEARLRVRIGLHTGEALVRGGDYVGHDVHKAKRVQDAGHGGQILLSHTTAELVRDMVALTDLGAHRLKDLGEPQHLFQVKADGLQGEFPPLRSLDSAPHNLPVQLTSFVGRESELAEIAGLLASHRLVTLTGVGGCGKTRLAIHAAAAEVESSSDGVYFCDLSRLSDEEGLAPAIARILGIELAAERVGSMPAMEAVRNFLSRRSTLLVLDNCEHLIGAAAELVEDLLVSCPHLRILATSREALDVGGEHTWPIPSLDATGEAVQLFVERAAAVLGDFSLTDANRPEVDAICQRLDGIPLAIELAAAQIGHLGPRQIAQRLDRQFMTLTGGRRRVQRQQTLKAAMDWSWDLLDERDQTLLRRLSVFQGGCTLDAAEAVCGDGIDVVSGLRSLVAKSLVITQRTDDTVRYRLLETVRLYAEDKQAESDEADEIRTRHRDHYLAWLEAISIERTLWGPIFFESELLPEEDNIRAALRWSEGQGRYDLLARMLCGSRRLWTFLHAEAPRWFESALGAELPDELRGRLIAASLGTGLRGNLPRALADGEEAMRLLGDRPNPWLINVMTGHAQTAFLWGLLTRDAALSERGAELADAVVAAGRAVGPFWEGVAHLTRGAVLVMQQRNAEAAEALAECLRLTQDDGHRGVPYAAIDTFRALRHALGDEWTYTYDSLLRSAAKAITVVVQPLNVSAVLDLAEAGDHAGADRFMRELLDFTRERAPTLFFAVPFAYGGAVAGSRGEWERAARLLAASMSQGWIPAPGAYAAYTHWVPRVREALGSPRARELRKEGLAMSLDDAIDYLLAGVTGSA